MLGSAGRIQQVRDRCIFGESMRTGPEDGRQIARCCVNVVPPGAAPDDASDAAPMARWSILIKHTARVGLPCAAACLGIDLFAKAIDQRLRIGGGKVDGLLAVYPPREHWLSHKDVRINSRQTLSHLCRQFKAQVSQHRDIPAQDEAGFGEALLESGQRSSGAIGMRNCRH